MAQRHTRRFVTGGSRAGGNVKTLIEGATVVLPTGQVRTSVLIEDGRIAAIDPALHTSADRTVSATGLVLMPGVIDDQVHFREPGLTHKEDLQTATRACAKGGVTTFLEMPNTVPTTTTLERLHEKLALAAGKCLVNFGFYVGATPQNLAELKQAKRTPGIKIFLGSSTGELTCRRVTCYRYRYRCLCIFNGRRSFSIDIPAFALHAHNC
jgi:dihydroorotase